MLFTGGKNEKNISAEKKTEKIGTRIQKENVQPERQKSA